MAQEEVGIAEEESTTSFEADDNKEDSVQNEDTVEENEVADPDPEPAFSLADYEALNKEVEALRAELSELREFKLNVENQQKDALINSYFMLSDEDKKEVIEHKTEYTLDEIKSKLAVIYVEKNVNFDAISENTSEEAPVEEDPSLTFSLDDTEVAGYVPSFIEALRHTQKK